MPAALAGSLLSDAVPGPLLRRLLGCVAIVVAYRCISEVLSILVFTVPGVLIGRQLGPDVQAQLKPAMISRSPSPWSCLRLALSCSPFRDT